MGEQELTQKIALIEQRVGQLEKTIAEKPIRVHAVKRLLTSEEAASFLGMTVEGLRGLTHKKLISYYKPNGKNLYFDVDELTAWQKKHHFEAIYPAETTKEDN